MVLITDIVLSTLPDYTFHTWTPAKYYYETFSTHKYLTCLTFSALKNDWRLVIWSVLLIEQTVQITSYDLCMSCLLIEQTAQITSYNNRRSFLGVRKSSFSLRTHVIQHLLEIIMYIILVIFMFHCILSVFLRIIGNFLLNNGVNK